jgi:glycosyltransferase involved in cell wall biosynthesis
LNVGAGQRQPTTKGFVGRALRILWVKAGKLLPVDSGGKIRSYNILRQLDRNHEVTLISYYAGRRDHEYEAEVQRELPGTQSMCIAGREGSVTGESLRYLAHMFQRAPFAVSKFTHAQVRREVELRFDKNEFDVAVCDFLSASANFPPVLSTPTALFQHNVETILWKRMASTESNSLKRLAYQLEARKMLRYERSTIGRFHHIIAVSENDRRQMLTMNPTCTITVVPTGVDTQKFAVAPPASATPPRIVFVGSMDWEPNIDAVRYFIQEIFPIVRHEVPSASFQIVGRNPPAHIKQLASSSVAVTGTVPSINEYLRDAAVVVVPLRIGGGTRLKIFEAMAMGKAVVSTSIGAEGLDVKNGRDLVLADDATSFAHAINLLLRDAAVRRLYEEAAARLAVQFDWPNIGNRFAEILREVSCRTACSVGSLDSRTSNPR